MRDLSKTEQEPLLGGCANCCVPNMVSVAVKNKFNVDAVFSMEPEHLESSGSSVAIDGTAAGVTGLNCAGFGSKRGGHGQLWHGGGRAHALKTCQDKALPLPAAVLSQQSRRATTR